MVSLLHKHLNLLATQSQSLVSHTNTLWWYAHLLHFNHHITQITLSALAGIGKRATQSGEGVVGIALEDYSDDSYEGVIRVFVQNKKYQTLADLARQKLLAVDLSTNTDVFSDLADLAEKELMKTVPTISSVSIVSGLSGVFSGFLKPVIRIAKEFNLDPRDIFFKLGERKVVAGQEDLILEIAQDLIKQKRGKL